MKLELHDSDFGKVLEDSPVRTALKIARERIAKGWIRRAMRIGDSYCILGALQDAPLDARSAAVRAIFQKIYGKHCLMHQDTEGWPAEAHYVAGYNDHTTQAAVLDIIDKTLEDL